MHELTGVDRSKRFALNDAAPIMYSLGYVQFLHPFDSKNILITVEYWWEEIQFER